jgi:DNA-binding MarR family transcriptional regulator
MAGGYAKISIPMPDARDMRSIGLLLRGINFDFRQTVDGALREAGVGASFGEISPMMSLKLESGLNGAQLARHSMVSAQAMNAVLKELARKNYIERRPHPRSLRADSWHLTKDGLRLLERVREVLERVTATMLSGFSAREIRDLEDALQRCANNLERSPLFR